MLSCFERYRKPNRLRACLLISGFVVIICFAIYMYLRKQSIFGHLPKALTATNPTTGIQTEIDVQRDAHKDSTKLILQPCVRKFQEMPEIRMHEFLNIFNASEEKEEERNSINSSKCVPLSTSVGKTPICIYDPKIDVWVSGSIQKGGMWDEVGVYLMASFLEQNPDMQFLDIGCNIGTYTLQAAKMGRKVIAVDANKFNLRLLSKSLNLGGLQRNVTLVWNAITDIHETIKLTITTGNIGGSFVKSVGEVSRPSKFNSQTALAITLEDLIGFFKGNPIFIKIDIEGSEWKAFRGGERFLQEVNVRYILMEWMTYREGDNGRDVIRYMSDFGFHPYEVMQAPQRKLDVDKSGTWLDDVLWIKK